MAKAKKPAVKKAPAKKPATKMKSPAKAPAPKKAVPPPAKARTPWFDAKSLQPLIVTHAQRLGTFLEAMADGRIDDNELAAQEKRLVAIMKLVEPMLDDDLHERITQLLCETYVYDVMRLTYELQRSRPTASFRG
jgi:hypothetical protein